jgi:hypothetical protein
VLAEMHWVWSEPRSSSHLAFQSRAEVASVDDFGLSLSVVESAGTEDVPAAKAADNSYVKDTTATPECDD